MELEIEKLNLIFDELGKMVGTISTFTLFQKAREVEVKKENSFASSMTITERGLLFLGEQSFSLEEIEGFKETLFEKIKLAIGVSFAEKIERCQEKTK